MIIPILRGQILLEKPDTKEAFDAFAEALKIDPSRHDAYLGLASVYLMRGQAKNAQAILDDAVRPIPTTPKPMGTGPRSTWRAASTNRPSSTWTKSSGSRPARRWRTTNGRWLLATCPVAKFRDGRAAVDSAKTACELSGWKNPRYIATLAAAYAETGDFDRAAQGQERALSLLDPHSPEPAKYRRMLDRYRAKKPPHAVGLLEELGLKSYQPPAARESPG